MLPMSVTLSTPGWLARGAPGFALPGTTLKTPGGSRSPTSSASRSDERGGLCRRLRDHGIAGRKRGRNLAGAEHERMIEGDDAGHHAERLPYRVVQGVRPHRDRRAFHFGHEPGEEIGLGGLHDFVGILSRALGDVARYASASGPNVGA